MNLFLAEEIFDSLRFATPHVDDRRKERSKATSREVKFLENQLEKVDSVQGIHQYLPPEMWWTFSDGSTAAISNKWDTRIQRTRIYLSTILKPGMEPGGEEFTKHMLTRALQRLRERRAGRLRGLVNRLRVVLTCK